ncbi:undecaprenyldiphospho-muramoylpentapeptide beta-N-acetylglucosaminyltransferase [Kiloniella laminariae]|uniref:undecaprenyldiphospho-muramoylpentapeptide beta-N-acetylglucosaminyltransferase n=1 Tax=Kiloniella laminariae TaxID=454162 RepID=UPI000367363F|nr:undecaprenyldiphospho-muramoylpentapeptide beta-N-acetylglucosaminyltransferase [Kiloniella laminariae]
MSQTPNKTPKKIMKRQHIVLASGGTGGHMFPARALAEELIERGHKVSLVTDQRGQGFGNDLPQVTVHKVSAGGIAGGSLLHKALSAAKLAMGILQAMKKLRGIKADAVVAFGGYASVPAGLAGSFLGIPVYLHEQNAVLGRANRLLATRAKKICTSFRKVSHIPAGCENKVTLTGNPVRPAIMGLRDTPYPIPAEKSPLYLLVTGGSQGASVFNGLVPEALALLPEDLRQRIHISQQVRQDGESAESVSTIYKTAGITADLKSFFDDMPERLSSAHLVICRSGASTITELAAAGRPAILVPYPHATDDHQNDNAQDFADAGAGWLMSQSSLTARDLSNRLISLFSNTQLLQRAASCARSHAITAAASNLADLVCGSPEKIGDTPSTSTNVSNGAAA